MRIRKKIWAESELSCCDYFIKEPEAFKSSWKRQFSKEQPIHLDLGCGKGVFLAQIAYNEPETNYIGIDISMDILGVARRNIENVFQPGTPPAASPSLLSKAKAVSFLKSGDLNPPLLPTLQDRRPENIQLLKYNIERLSRIFSIEDGISRIYINFCNPWPKARGHKKRLTHTKQLEEFFKFLSPKGEIWFKTDDQDLYLATVRYFKEMKLKFIFKTEDLHAEKLADNVLTEHELMFSAQGMPIKAIRVQYCGGENEEQAFKACL